MSTTGDKQANDAEEVDVVNTQEVDMENTQYEDQTMETIDVDLIVKGIEDLKAYGISSFQPVHEETGSYNSEH